MLVAQDRIRRKTTRPSTTAVRSKRLPEQAGQAEPLIRWDAAIAHCSLCARDARYGRVYKGGSIFCSIECAEAVAGMYLG